MRKVLSFVLVLSLVLGSFGMAFAAPLSDMAGEKSEDAVSVLTQLGVVSGYPDGTYKPDNIVTRAEMAVIVVRALGLADYATGTSNFSDMGGHWSNPYVAYATSLGIIAGYPDGTFRPDKTVSYDEAATMLVAALGYNADSLTGTWPANFVVKAKSLGILDGIKAGSAGANRGDIAIMAFQTLDAKIGSTDKDGKWTANDPDDTMLIRLGAELYNEGDAFVVTGDEDSVINLKPFIGAYVTAYQNDDEEIIAIKDVKSTFLTGNFTENVTSVGAIANGDKFDADKTYTVDLVDDAVTAVGLKNGATANIGTLDDAKDYTIAVKVSGSKIKEVYSVHEWVVSADDQVTDADLAKITAKTPSLLSVEFALDDNDDIDTNSFDLVGAATLSDIEEDNIVYVYAKGGTGDIVKIVVGTEVVTGEVSKIKGSSYTIGGKDYKFANAAGIMNDADTTPDVDDEITAYLDGFGRIYQYESTTKASNHAVVLAVKDGEKAPDGELGGTTAQIKLFLADGTNKTFDVDTGEYANISGAAIATYDGSAFDWVVEKGDVVKYGLNKDGEINTMTSVVDVDSTATAAGIKISATGYFDGYKIASDALIFTYDGFTHKADDYGVTTLDKVLKSDVDGDAWYTKNSSNVITFLYLPTSTSSDDEVYGVIIDAEKNNSSAGYGVDLLVDGEEVFYNADTDYRGWGTTEYMKLYLVKFAADGTVSDLDDQVGISVSDAELYRNVIDGTYSLASDVVVYVWNATDGVYEVGSTSDIDGEDVELFDVFGDDDGAYDIVLVK